MPQASCSHLAGLTHSPAIQRDRFGVLIINPLGEEEDKSDSRLLGARVRCSLIPPFSFLGQAAAGAASATVLPTNADEAMTGIAAQITDGKIAKSKMRGRAESSDTHSSQPAAHSSQHFALCSVNASGDCRLRRGMAIQSSPIAITCRPSAVITTTAIIHHRCSFLVPLPCLES